MVLKGLTAYHCDSKCHFGNFNQHSIIMRCSCMLSDQRPGGHPCAGITHTNMLEIFGGSKVNL